MLGSGDGWVATPGDRLAAKVVPPGDGPGGDERNGPGCTYFEYAHKDERVLPEQVRLCACMRVSCMYACVCCRALSGYD